MNRLMRIGAWLAALGLTSGQAFAHEPHAHVHEIASLQLAIDGNILTLDFASPLDNLLGFEHAPRTDKQKTAIRNMADRLRKADVVFITTPAAHCTSSSIQLDSPVLGEALTQPSGKKASAPTHHKDADHDDDDHADLSAEYVFTCEHPDNLRDLEVKLFDYFPNLRRVDVQVASARGQSAAKLTPGARRVSW